MGAVYDGAGTNFAVASEAADRVEELREQLQLPTPNIFPLRSGRQD